MSNLVTPKGRARRREYILVNLIYTIIYIPIYFSIKYLTPVIGNIDISDVLFLFLFLISFFPLMIIVTIKRFHDIGYSGWATLLLFVPIINIGGGFLLLFKDGTIGTNKYGEDPKKRISKEAIIDFENKEKEKIIKKEKICSHCGMTNIITLRYCKSCGYELSKIEIS